MSRTNTWVLTISLLLLLSLIERSGSNERKKKQKTREKERRKKRLWVWFVSFDAQRIYHVIYSRLVFSMGSAYDEGKYKIQVQTNASYHDNYASCSVVDKKPTDECDCGDRGSLVAPSFSFVSLLFLSVFHSLHKVTRNLFGIFIYWRCSHRIDTRLDDECYNSFSYWITETRRN